jgi:hypothetical protein
MMISSSASEFTLSVLQLDFSDFVESFDDFSMSVVSVLLAAPLVIFEEVGIDAICSKEDDEGGDDFDTIVCSFVDNEVEPVISDDANPQIRNNFTQPERELTLLTLV